MQNPQRSPLTNEQIAIAKKLKGIWLQKKAERKLIQAEVAEKMGITQGSFTQYLNQHIAVNTDFVLDFCRALDVEPSNVHRRYRDIRLVR